MDMEVILRQAIYGGSASVAARKALRERVDRAIDQVHTVEDSCKTHNRENGKAIVNSAAKNDNKCKYEVDLRGTGSGPTCQCEGKDSSVCDHMLRVLVKRDYTDIELIAFGWRGYGNVNETNNKVDKASIVNLVLNTSRGDCRELSDRCLDTTDMHETNESEVSHLLDISHSAVKDDENIIEKKKSFWDTFTKAFTIFSELPAVEQENMKANVYSAVNRQLSLRERIRRNIYNKTAKKSTVSKPSLPRRQLTGGRRGRKNTGSVKLPTFTLPPSSQLSLSSSSSITSPVRKKQKKNHHPPSSQLPNETPPLL